MKKILVLGAGRCSHSLIVYLVHKASQMGWQVIVGDYDEQQARQKVGLANGGLPIQFDIHDEGEAVTTITNADVIISLLPSHFHPLVARHCITLGKHFLSASYVSEEMRAFDLDARKRGLLFLNECGLDPGIDHMSAMQVINRIRASGASVESFESFTGGLIAPDTDLENPWRYKFTWNPRNVVMAGQGTAKFLEEGKYKCIPYQQLFKRTTKVIVPGYGDYEGYANRDSLGYRETYGLTDIKTMLRGTLRNKGFCSAWDILVQLGCCDDTYLMEDVEQMTHRDFLNTFVRFDPHNILEDKICSSFLVAENGEEMKRLRWSELFSDEKIGLKQGTPAQILEHILSKKWKLNPEDKDLIVMWHRFRFLQNGRQREIQASLVAQGEDAVNTAMSKTVGLPLACATRLLVQGKIRRRGVVLPVHEEFYEPILTELKTLGVELTERHIA